MSADDRTSDAVAVENVRRLLAGTLAHPEPGTLAAEVRDWGLRAAAHALQQGRSFGRAEAAAERAIAQAVEILGIKR